MSEPYEPDDEEIRQAALTFLAAQDEDDGPALRWTPTTLVIDMLNAMALVLEGVASFFNGQVRSLAARASLKEELKDHALREQLKAEARSRMKRNTLEDIASLPEMPEQG